MFAASIWSLIIPAIEMEVKQGKIGWIPASIGIIVGVAILLWTDSFVEKWMDKKQENGQGKKRKMLSLAITLHNIPEGMAVGIVFASSLTGNYGVQMMSAMALAIGIAIQNFPEGMAIALPAKADGFSNRKSFVVGMLSGIVEPIAAIVTLLMSSLIRVILPYLLAFAAGAMLYVIICELIPDSQEGEDSKLATWGVIIRFFNHDDFRCNPWLKEIYKKMSKNS